jgi:hypothetical protein
MQNKTLHQAAIRENQTDFFVKLETIAKQLSVEPNWLMAVFYVETAAASHSNTIDHRRVNSIGCCGLIQFCPRGGMLTIGKTLSELQNMTNVQQLDCVYDFLKPYKGRMKSYSDVHLAVFYPSKLGKPDNYIFPENVRAQNPFFFRNTPGTLGDFRSKCDRIFANEMQRQGLDGSDTPSSAMPPPIVYSSEPSEPTQEPYSTVQKALILALAFIFIIVGLFIAYYKKIIIGR